jgi:hypothetical protein
LLRQAVGALAPAEGSQAIGLAVPPALLARAKRRSNKQHDVRYWHKVDIRGGGATEMSVFGWKADIEILGNHVR